MSKASTTLILTLFDRGNIVLRDTLVHTNQFSNSCGCSGLWTSSTPVLLRSPLPKTETARASLSIVTGGNLRCTLFAFEPEVKQDILMLKRDALSHTNAIVIQILPHGASKQNVFIDARVKNGLFWDLVDSLELASGSSGYRH